MGPVTRVITTPFTFNKSNSLEPCAKTHAEPSLFGKTDIGSLKTTTSLLIPLKLPDSVNFVLRLKKVSGILRSFIISILFFSN